MNEIENRIKGYLSSGGLFNPELMEHEKVRDLIIDCCDELSKLRAQLAHRDEAIKVMREALELIALENIYVGENGWKDEHFLDVKQTKGALSKAEQILGDKHGD